MLVRRIEDECGSHIEPPFQADWPEKTKLRWWAEVAALDTGGPVPTVRYSTGSPPGGFDIQFASSSTVGPLGYDQAWTLLNGYVIGWRQARRSAA